MVRSFLKFTVVFGIFTALSSCAYFGHRHSHDGHKSKYHHGQYKKKCSGKGKKECCRKGKCKREARKDSKKNKSLGGSQ